MSILKRLYCYIFAIAVSLGCIVLGGCNTNFDDGKIDVVCTIFPIYDWASEVVGDTKDYELTLLVNNGTDMHSYQPTFLDTTKIITADAVIYVGGESDEWIEEILVNKQNPNMKIINLMNILGDKAKEEEFKDGMSGEREEESELDEHIWLSLKNAQLFVVEIARILGQMDSANADLFSSRATTYNASLNQLDEQYSSAVNSSVVKTLLFGDRFPFRYLVDDYNLEYFAAFPGCSAETEASFQTITFLAKKVNELNLKAICKTETADSSIANAIKEATTNKNQAILSLNSMQSTTLTHNASYLDIMTSNLSILVQALS